MVNYFTLNCPPYSGGGGCTPYSGGGRGISYFPYILLNEIQTMFSQLAKRSERVLPADLCTDHVHYVKNHRSKQKHGGRRRDCFSLLYFGNSQIYWSYVAFQMFLLNNFPVQSLKYVTLHRTLMLKVKVRARHAFTLKQKNLFQHASARLQSCLISNFFRFKGHAGDN